MFYSSAIHRQSTRFLGYFLYSLVLYLSVVTRPAQTSHSKYVKFCTYPPHDELGKWYFLFFDQNSFSYKKN